LAHACIAVLLGFLVGCARKDEPRADGRVVVHYWEKWVGHEAEAMRQVVDDFNRSQDKIWVSYLSVSQIDRKLLLSVSGGNPPDVAGLWSQQIAAYSESNALIPLDALARRSGIREEDYLKMCWDSCRHEGYLWALPTTPAVLALYWNKRLFREAGLDPDRPPRSLAELEKDNERLLLRDRSGRIVRLGHSPEEPDDWYDPFWVYWFGGTPIDAHRGVRVNDPEFQACFRWLGSYATRFGGQAMERLRDGSLGAVASPQNPFFNGRVAMVLQGPWFYDYMKKYAPEDIEWGVAAFPSVDPERLPDVTAAMCDVMVIPAGARHPREAFAFMAFVNRRAEIEKLCLGQGKFSPLRVVSPGFYKRHPNPDIQIFARLAASPNARIMPPYAICTEYMDALTTATNEMILNDPPVDSILGPVQARLEKSHLREQEHWNRVKEKRLEEWSHDVAE